MKLQTLNDVGNLEGLRVILRGDCNVPVENRIVVDDFRIKALIPTISYLVDAKAKVLLVSHIGENGEDTLKPVAEYLSKIFPVSFVATLEEVPASFKEGTVTILENIRSFKGEMENDDAFSKKLADLGDVYVNDAFSVSHRSQASIVGVPKFLKSCMGLRFEREVTELSRAFTPVHPFLFILGGAKFETKLPLIEKFFELADTVFVGGALANDFFRAKKFPIGRSMVSKAEVNAEVLHNHKLLIPSDVTTLSADGERAVKSASEVSDTEIILDCGPETVTTLSKKISESKLVLWNGPLGAYERGFIEQTEKLAQIIAESGVTSIVGGGDTIASIQRLHLEDKFSFMSTGGGAMLDFLLDGTLPGIQALERGM